MLKSMACTIVTVLSLSASANIFCGKLKNEVGLTKENIRISLEPKDGHAALTETRTSGRASSITYRLDLQKTDERGGRSYSNEIYFYSAYPGLNRYTVWTHDGFFASCKKGVR